MSVARLILNSWFAYKILLMNLSLHTEVPYASACFLPLTRISPVCLVFKPNLPAR